MAHVNKYLEANPKTIRNFIEGFVEGDAPGCPFVIDAPPGSGKTKSLIKFVGKRFRNNDSCLIVVDFLKDARRLKKAINKKAGEKICFIWYGYNQELCVHKDYKYVDRTTDKNKFNFCKKNCNIGYPKCLCHPDKYKYARKKRVLIVTHKKLNSILITAIDKTEVMLSRFGEREYVFIDEKPDFMKHQVLTRGRFYKKVKKAGLSRKRKLTNEIFNNTDKIFKTHTDKKNMLIESVHSDDFPNFEYWLSFDEVGKVVKNIYTEGGMVCEHKLEVDKDFLPFYVPAKIHTYKSYYMELFKFAPYVLIFDGTACTDLLYKLFKFKVVKFRREVIKSRLHILNHNRHKSSLISKKKRHIVRAQILEELQEIHRQHPKEIILVITTKKSEKWIKKFNLDYIILEHYGNLKGRNDLLKYKVMYFTHVHQKPQFYYAGICKAARKFDVDPITVGRRSTGSTTFGFENKKIESVRIMDIVTEMIQNTYRCSIRDNKVSADIYIGMTDWLLINALLDKMPELEFIKEDF